MFSQKKVLVVEDQAFWRDLFVELLEKEKEEGNDGKSKYEVVAAADYDAAMAILQQPREIPFHVAVVDMRLDESDSTNEDGLRLVSNINRLSPTTNAIVVTGYSTVRTRTLAGMALRLSDYLEKYPENGEAFNHRQFLEKVSAAAEDSQQRRPPSRCPQPSAFVVMPFAPQYQTMYDHVLKKIVESEGFQCIRADNLFKPGRIIDDIRRSIQEADFILADFSGRSPNVFYEIGMAHAICQKVILMTRTLEDVPPKLRDLRCILYEDSLEGAAQLEEKLRLTIAKIKQKDDSEPPFSKGENSAWTRTYALP